MTDLIEFLQARLDEDASIAAGAGEDGPHWRGTNDGLYPGDVSRHPGPFAVGPYDHLPDQYAEHIARHDPARVLAEVAAKRAMISHCASAIAEADASEDATSRTDMAYVLRLLALPYADHSDFREEWRP